MASPSTTQPILPPWHNQAYTLAVSVAADRVGSKLIDRMQRLFLRRQNHRVFTWRRCCSWGHGISTNNTGPTTTSTLFAAAVISTGTRPKENRLAGLDLVPPVLLHALAASASLLMPSTLSRSLTELSTVAVTQLICNSQQPASLDTHISVMQRRGHGR